MIDMDNLNTYEVWTEGYVVTGGSSGAVFHGAWKGVDFKDAVKNYAESVEDPYARSTIDLDRMTFWGCKFFDNEADARKSFG